MKNRGFPVKIIIAGGGTGGHVFPALAIAEELLRRDEGHQVLFIGTRRGLEAKIVPSRGFDLKVIDVVGLKGKGFLGSLGGLSRIPRSMGQSRSIIKEFKPDLVLGVGGYASGPAVMTAHFMGIRTAIAEQNAEPGFTNAVLGKFTNRIFVSFEDTRQWFPIMRVVYTGNPVRAGFFEARESRLKEKGIFTILVFGGSQGASAINRIMTEALPFLQDLKQAVGIIHQAGVKDVKSVAAAYETSGMNAEVHQFIDDMPSLFRTADLLVCRAGATSIAEITAAGKAAILIPYPYAAGNHQALNAGFLVRRGAAEMIEEKDCTGEILASRIRTLYGNRAKLQAMEEASKALGRPLAARTIVDHCLEMIGVI
ncbi:MAG: undecaprenyldiphospho-muramoylpentapeptide beta-N-acetylglucosaminyltransferase [Syntrophales bacterium]|jgi:UDP-N-acetylglucosamine--N-acetylmuramyl-(pentapeptide) pyrophosphoryl-undecaprenol N-acetylglucosamine transferase|nr:undecaprenyldiphospho-muramoylpentapeptide beta-N-acetylglucosaminyltransferase [Syntrophales bacterium]MCK9528618.1 undecaprenyldiphospho-muramoylpentapeptide beta-N-acetylglucosaminyltransferase [Syntrophales bacterium]MDX9923059.1 undecaprenyldiphospho-muramoylpentapeptide beta-N-acetylglucosaminyltransferase [Syntrophales bacterium]